MSQNPGSGGKPIAIIIIIVILILAGGGAWYFFSYKPAQEAKEKARLERIAQEEAAQRAEEEKKARYDQLIVDADAALEQENWQVAQADYSEASSLYPNEQYPKDQLTIVNAKLDELAALEAQRQAGEVNTVSTSTGRYYVIVSSSIDGDLAMDYATKLAKEGNNVKIIPPSGRNRLFHRVSIDDFADLSQAVAATQSYSSLGEGVWVLGY